MSALTKGQRVHRVQTTVTVMRTVTKRTEHAKGWSESRRAVPDYDASATIEIWVDADAIVKELAKRAILSTRGTVQRMHGAIVIRARHISKTREYPRNEAED